MNAVHVWSMIKSGSMNMQTTSKKSKLGLGNPLAYTCFLPIPSRVLRERLQKRKIECKADSLVPMRLAIFPFHLSKVLPVPRKSDAKSYEVLYLSRKIILANLTIWCSKMQPLSGNQRTDLLTCLTHVSLVLRLPCEMHLCRSSSKNVFENCYKTLTSSSLLAGCRIRCACHTQRRFNVQKWREHVVF